MNRWTGTGHLTKDPKLLETDERDRDLHAADRRPARRQAGRRRLLRRQVLRRARRTPAPDYLKSGREVAIDGRLLFDEFQTQDGGYASRVYVVAERVEFLASRTRATGQASDPDARPNSSPPPAASRAATYPAA